MSKISLLFGVYIIYPKNVQQNTFHYFTYRDLTYRNPMHYFSKAIYPVIPHSADGELMHRPR